MNSNDNQYKMYASDKADVYIGHKREDGKTQLLKDHLTGVMNLAEKYAQSFGAGDHARRAGILHDAGKYSRAGQRRMADPENTRKVDHSTAGAQIAIKECRNDVCAALAIVGHHGGIPDCGGKFSAEGDGTLMGRMKKELTGEMDYSAFWKENTIARGNVLPEYVMTNPFAVQFYVRMLYSCLVDADFLDTEQFMQEKVDRKTGDDMTELLRKLKIHIEPWMNNPETKINQKRCEILQTCLAAGEKEKGLYTLTVPTGGGKTVSSFAFSLTHAVKHKAERIIYVIPFTSIIDQNAEVFKSIVGDENVIEHHSGVEYDVAEDNENSVEMKRMLATENWDAPIIVTTAVQFFESLFSNKPSKCRKLHNIANSVIIFDEAQMLPVSYLIPCVYAIAELVKNYNSTAVLCTATQPALNRYFKKYDKKLSGTEIIPNVDELQTFFRRVHFSQRYSISMDDLVSEMAGMRQVLCIVNTRKTAQTLYEKLKSEGTFHLSTWMTPAHRKNTLKEIRRLLKEGKACRVISTSLIEAGVDVDFPEVWREMAGIDSILQAAGRCNRNGKYGADESEVVVFSLEEGIPKGMKMNAAAAQIAMEKSEYLDDAATVRRYFESLYWMKGDEVLDEKGIIEMCKNLRMKTIAENFRMIESDTRTIYIPNSDNENDLEMLRLGQISRSLMRRLGQHAVNVYTKDWEVLRKTGRIEVIDHDMAILTDFNSYDDYCGLKIPEDLAGIEIMIKKSL